MLDEKLLRELFDEALSRSGTFGAQLSIIKGSHRIDLAAGFTHAGLGRRMSVKSVVQIGSITKVLNAALIIALVEGGILELDAPVHYYIPHFAVADPDVTRTLSLRHLISMSSGLDNGPFAYFGEGETALAEYVTHLGALPSHFRPGSHFGYSNAGVCVAGHAASRVSGKSWESLLRERILEPIGVSKFASLDGDVDEHIISFGHIVSQDSRALSIVAPRLSSARARAPSGSALSLSAADLADFGNIFLSGGMAKSGAEVLPYSGIKKMMTPAIAVPTRKYGTHWGSGPYRANWNGVTVWGHGGTSLTSTSFLHWFPEKQGVVAFAVNTHVAMAEFSRIVFEEILEAAFGFRRPDIEASPTTALPSNHRRYVGTYEELGMRMQVSSVGEGCLLARFTPRSAEYSFGLGREQVSVLKPVGGDRFLIVPEGGFSGHRGAMDMAFFGEDAEGRATNALNLVFPMSRVM